MTVTRPDFLRQPSPNCDSRNGQTVDILLLHYTGMTSGAAALARLCDPAAEVSAHYLIEEDGRTFSLVDEKARAWHAGAASWQGARDINARSVGIELVNPGHEFGYRDFPEAQMAALIPLCQDIVARHGIPAARVLGHSDVAPLRKEDPGERFDWQRLARAGIGLWPDNTPAIEACPAEAELRAQLTRFGYDAGEAVAFDKLILAFQRHFRPERVDGRADRETAARLAALLALCDETRA